MFLAACLPHGDHRLDSCEWHCISQIPDCSPFPFTQGPFTHTLTFHKLLLTQVQIQIMAQEKWISLPLKEQKETDLLFSKHIPAPAPVSPQQVFLSSCADTYVIYLTKWALYLQPELHFMKRNSFGQKSLIQPSSTSKLFHPCRQFVTQKWMCSSWREVTADRTFTSVVEMPHTWPNDMFPKMTLQGLHTAERLHSNIRQLTILNWRRLLPT